MSAEVVTRNGVGFAVEPDPEPPPPHPASAASATASVAIPITRRATSLAYCAAVLSFRVAVNRPSGVLLLVLIAVFSVTVVPGCGGGSSSSSAGTPTATKTKKAESAAADPARPRCPSFSGKNLRVCEDAYRACSIKAQGVVERFFRGEGEPFWEWAHKYSREGYLAGGPDTELADAAELGCGEAMEAEYRRLFR
jgi:hypothetical protein